MRPGMTTGTADPSVVASPAVGGLRVRMARRETSHVLSRDGETARKQLLISARTVILRYGLVKTTMEDIAGEAGVSRPTIYRYFSDRTQLISALTDWHARKVQEDSRQFLRRQIAAGKPFQEYFVAGLINVITSAHNDPILRAVISPGSQQQEPRLVTFDLAVKLTSSLWDPFFDEAITKGEMRDDLERSELYTWLAQVQLSLFARMDTVDLSDSMHARQIRTYVLPALITPSVARSTRNGGRSSTQE